MDRRDLKIQVAKMYYIEGLSQDEISKNIHVSRPSVSRLLQSCIKEGIVQIKIDDVSSFGKELGKRIVETYGIGTAIVFVSVIAFYCFTFNFGYRRLYVCRGRFLNSYSNMLTLVVVQ
jgi:DNA-binding transcriptional regulator LsrR (DeoR family)